MNVDVFLLPGYRRRTNKEKRASNSEMWLRLQQEDLAFEIGEAGSLRSLDILDQDLGYVLLHSPLAENKVFKVEEEIAHFPICLLIQG